MHKPYPMSVFLLLATLYDSTIIALYYKCIKTFQ